MPGARVRLPSSPAPEPIGTLPQPGQVSTARPPGKATRALYALRASTAACAAIAEVAAVPSLGHAAVGCDVPGAVSMVPLTTPPEPKPDVSVYEHSGTPPVTTVSSW